MRLSSGGRDDLLFYKGMISHLQTKGTVLTEHIGEASLQSMGEEGVTEEAIYKRYRSRAPEVLQRVLRHMFVCPDDGYTSILLKSQLDTLCSNIEFYF